MVPPRPPEPGTPAYTATADQLYAAQHHATVQVAALFHAGARLVEPTGPWALRMFESVTPDAPARKVCPQVRDMRGPAPMYVIEPATLRCHPCTAREAPAAACSLCGNTCRGLLGTRPHLAQYGLVVAYAPLCFPCSYREHHPEGP